MSVTQDVDLIYLAGSGLELADPVDDVRGMTVVDHSGHRLGEVADLVVDARERRARLLSVVSGGILGLSLSERLIPVETVTRVDDRVRVDWSPSEAAGTSAGAGPDRESDGTLFAAAYDELGIVPYWAVSHRADAYFHRR